jgi:WD40 repeat protein
VQLLLASRRRWLVVAGAALLSAARGQAPQLVAWQPGPRVECRGGTIVAASFNATGSRVLTAGEEGDLILWDAPAGRELHRYPAFATRAQVLRMHPRDPWALVITGRGKDRAVHVLDLGSGRRRLLWQRDVCDVAFDSTGTKVAMLVDDEKKYPLQELLVYRDSALLAGDARADFSQSTRGARLVLFAPEPGLVVLIDRYEGHQRLSLTFGYSYRSAGEILGFLPSGEPVLADHDIREPMQVCGPWSAQWPRDELVRRGPVPCRWRLPDRGTWHQLLAVASNGMVAVADGKGALFLFGPEIGAEKELSGHLGQPLQLVFSGDSETLAMAGRRDVTFVGSQSGLTHSLSWPCSVQAMGRSGFHLLREHTLLSYDAPTQAVGPPQLTWAEPGAASLSLWSWTGTVDAVPFAWVEPRTLQGVGHAPTGRLWLGELTTDDKTWSGAGAVIGAAKPVRLDCSVPDQKKEVCPHMRLSAIAPVANGGMLTAEKTMPIQCGNGRQDVRCWGALRLFDRDGKLLRRRFLPASVERLRVSPHGRCAVLLPKLVVVDTTLLETIAESRTPANWIDFAFVDDSHALATDGERLVAMTIPGLQQTALPLPVGVSRIDALALSPDGAQLAIACGATVHLFVQPSRPASPRH